MTFRAGGYPTHGRSGNRKDMVRILALLAALAIPSSLLGQRKGCGETKYPKHLPSPRELIDSAGAIAALKASDRLSDAMLFSLLYTETDSLPHVRSLEGADPQAALVLLRSVRSQKPSGTWAVRVRIVAGASPALMLERSIYCPPVPLPGPHPEGIPVRVLVEPRPGDRLPPAGRTRIDFEALVGEDGMPLRVRMLQSSGMSDFDEQVTREWEQRQFQPALLDGAPIQALYRTDGLAPRP